MMAVRREKALELHAYQRLSLNQIRVQLEKEGIKVTAKTISKDIDWALAQCNARAVRNAAHGQMLSALRLDHLDRQLVPLALGMLPPGKTQVVGRGKDRKVITAPMDGAEATRLRLAAIDLLRKNEESRRRLFAWDQQRDDGGFTAEQVARLLAAVRVDLLELVRDEPTRLAIAKALQRRSGMLPGTAIEAHVEGDGKGDDDRSDG